MRDFTSRIPTINKLNYWQRLKNMKLNLLQRRYERYKIIYVWKTIDGLVPESDVTLLPEDERKWRVCKIPALKPKEREEFPSATTHRTLLWWF